ncbi:1-phosphofructokinase [Blautia sp.]|uniref:1-phosphofructokinase n=1 Tax=Blautia sp. TaxID=1955243 RepID=UPI0025C680D1|nr:1-phosphofructokinase [Blautia sp.]
MIITVTMNPAIDKTVEIEQLVPNGLNRIQKVEYDAGGKGINVSKTIHELGGESLAMGFLGGNAGKTIENVLTSWNIQHDFIWVEGETRTNTKVFEKSGGVTELNEPGPVINEARVEELIQKICEHTDKETLVVLAGSIPAGVDKNIYAAITESVHEKGGSVLMDADGELFRNALKASPDIIKPNQVELEEYIGADYRLSMGELKALSEKFQNNGIKTVVISMGKGGAMIVRDKFVARCPALSVKAHSTVGAGDAMVAALAYSWDKKLGDEETVRLCMATSAGAVTTVGTKPPARAVVDELIPQVEMEIL